MVIIGFHQVFIYFSGTELTIMAWLKFRSLDFSKPLNLINIGCEPSMDKIVITLIDPYLFSYSFGTSVEGGNSTTEALKLDQWQHLSFVFSFPSFSVYIDGIDVTTPGSTITDPSFSLKNIVRTLNYVGRSNWYMNGDLDADADFDDLKLFNRALTQTEIQFEMNNNL